MAKDHLQFSGLEGPSAVFKYAMEGKRLHIFFETIAKATGIVICELWVNKILVQHYISTVNIVPKLVLKIRVSDCTLSGTQTAIHLILISYCIYSWWFFKSLVYSRRKPYTYLSIFCLQ